MKSMQLKKTILAISLIHHRFHALAVVKDQIQGSWEAPDPVETSEQLWTALKEAVRVTKFPGKKVSYLVEDPCFVHQYLQVPPMKPHDLHSFLSRRVEQEKTWPGPALWRHRRSLQDLGKVGVLLDICPKDFVDNLINICEDLDLWLINVAPLSAVFMDQVRTLSGEPDDVLMLVTIMGGKTSMVVARGDGTPLFDRFLSPSHPSINQGARIGREINRTTLFLGKQFRTTISQVWFMGEPGEVSIEDIQPHLDMPMFQNPVVPDPKYWLWVGAMLPLNHQNNFISPMIRLAPTRKMLGKVVGSMVAAMFLIGIGLTGLLEGVLIQEQGLVQAMTTQRDLLAKEKLQWQDRLALRHSQERRAKALTEGRESVAGPFLGYLGNVIPNELVLTKVSLVHDVEGWKVELMGTAPSNLTATPQTLGQLESRLAEGPFHLQINPDWRQQWLQGVKVGKKEIGRSSFEMSGRIP